MENNSEAQGTPRSAESKIALLTGGSDPHYAYGLATALAASGVPVDFIGGDQDDSPELGSTINLHFLNLHRSVRGGFGKKLWQVTTFYFRLIGYAASSKAQIFHILWNNKLETFDRTLLTLYYKLLGKKIVLTAHNVNARARDGRDSAWNRLTLRIQYKLADHILVHTSKMKQELGEQFAVVAHRVTVIPYGVNNALPNSDLTSREAKERLGLGENDRAILFFGAIKKYKGLEYLVEAFAHLASNDTRYRLIIAGDKKKGHEEYWENIQSTIAGIPSKRVIQEIKFISDRDTELFFKAADVTALPYTEIFQSGILFLAYSFGLPVIASDVGSFRQDVVNGSTGFICKAKDSEDLASVIRDYFESDLYKRLGAHRQQIRDHVNQNHSWKRVAEITRGVYGQLQAAAQT